MTQQEQTRTENVQVNNFIKKWQKENPYKGNIKIHNRKFKNDFNDFLNSNNFSEQTINLYKIK